jgi:hypothetical protein
MTTIQIHIEPKPLRIGQQHQTYNVYYYGTRVLTRSRDPEMDAARWIAAHQPRTKRIECCGMDGQLRTIVNVEWAKEHRTQDGQKTIQFVKYKQMPKGLYDVSTE